jgi:cation diffusion facilitator CzcD-associated flavoprotein CzcO
MTGKAIVVGAGIGGLAAVEALLSASRELHKLSL